MPFQTVRQQRAQRSQQQFLEQLAQLQQVTPKKSVAGFLGNFVTDIGAFLRGVGTLIVLPYAKSYQFITQPRFRQEQLNDWSDYFKHPSNTFMKNIYIPAIKPMLDDLAEWKHPLEAMYNKPFSRLMDITTIASFGAGASAKTLGQAAKVTRGLQAVSEITSLKTLGRAGEVVGKTLGFGDLIDRMKAEITAQRLKSQVDFVHYIKRNKELKQIIPEINKLTDAEINSLIPMAEGTLTIPRASANLTNAVGKLKNYIRLSEKELIDKGILTKEQTIARRWQPIKKTYLKESGKEYSVKELQKIFPKADPVYLRHFFDEKNILKSKKAPFMSPGFKKPSTPYLKPSKGAPGYFGELGKRITKGDLIQHLATQIADTEKYKSYIRNIDTLEKQPFVEVLTSKNPLKEGYKPFYPEFMKRMYKGILDASEQVKKKISKASTESGVDIEASLQKALEEAFPQKEYIGLTSRGVKAYQMPAAIADVFNHLDKPGSPLMRLVWDKPTDFFRVLSLSTPRFIVNNLLSHIFFQAMSGNLFPRFDILRYAFKHNLFPDELLYSGLSTQERTLMAQLDASTGSTIGGVINKVGQYRAVKKTTQGLKWYSDLIMGMNEGIDRVSRGLIYIKEARKLSIEKLRKQNKSIGNFAELLEVAKNDPEIVAKAMKRTNDAVYSMVNLLPFERTVLRRIFPFYSWLRWSAGYAMRMTFDEPLKSAVLRRLTLVTNSMTGQDKLPKWLKGSIPIDIDEDGKIIYFKSAGINPLQQIAQMFEQGLVRGLFLNTAPQIKSVYEAVAKEELYSGKEFSQKGVINLYGKYYKFDPESKKIVETDKPSANFVEIALRNYIPYYIMLEDQLAGQERYTSAGLPSILRDREGVKKVLPEGWEPKSMGPKYKGLLGLPIGETPSVKDISEKTQKNIATQILKQYKIKKPKKPKKIKIKKFKVKKLKFRKPKKWRPKKY